MKKLSLLLVLTVVTTAAAAQHQIVIETGDTIRCQISTVSNTYIHFLNDEDAGRKVSIPFVSAVYYADQWWNPVAFRDAYGTVVEIDDRSMMRAERLRSKSPSALLVQSGRLYIAAITVPILTGIGGVLIDGDLGIVIAAAGAVVGFVCLVAGGYKLRNAGIALERYENAWDEKPKL